MQKLFSITISCLVMVFWQGAVVRPAAAGVEISVDTITQQMTVSVDGSQHYAWPVSTGRQGYATPAGSFRPFRMEREHFSREWDDAPMPYSIFFTERGHAIHGTRSTSTLGTAVSHGCVRLAPDNAAVLFSLVQAHGLADTEVEIVGGGFADDPYLWPSAGGDESSRLDLDRFIRLLDGS